MDALYHPLGDDRYQPSELTRGGWSDESQHGGPPCGLLAHAIERHPTPGPMTTVRVTFDLYRQVPLTPLRVEVRPLREGRRIQVLDAVLRSGDQDVGSARALRIRATDVDLPAAVPTIGWDPPPGPELGRQPAMEGWGRGLVRFHLDAIEISSIDVSFESAGPGLAWFRLRYPTVAEVPTSPFVRLATIADMGNGLTRVLDHQRYIYVNPDITLYVFRMPAAEWVGMRGVSYPQRDGHGLADTQVFDEDGPVGRIAQAQLIERHDLPSGGRQPRVRAR